MWNKRGSSCSVLISEQLLAFAIVPLLQPLACCHGSSASMKIRQIITLATCLLVFDKRTTGDEQFHAVMLFCNKMYYEAFLNAAAAVHASQQMMTNGKTHSRYTTLQ